MPEEIVVLPTHAHAAFARAEKARAAPRGLAMGRGVITLGELFTSVSAAALPGVRVLGRLEERLVLRLVAASDVAGARFDATQRTPGFVGALGATVAACRKAGVTPARMKAVLGALPRATAERAAAVAVLLEAFDAELARLGAVDEEGAPWAVAEALRAGAALPPALAASARVVVRHVHELSPARLAFFDALASRIGEVVIELPHDECFVATERILERAEAAGAAASLTILPTPPSESARGLGALVSEALAGRAPVEPSGVVEVVAAPSPRAEHLLVARRVRDLVDRGIPPERIAIAARDLDAHARPLSEALWAAGVPVHERRGVRADETPPVRFLFDVMTAAAEGLDKEAVLRLLANVYAPRWAEGRARAAEVHRVLSELGVRGAGRDHGGDVLVAALDRLSASEKAPLALGRVRADVADFIERAAQLGQPGTVTELIARVRRFVDVSGLADAAQRPASSLGSLLAGASTTPAAEAEALAFGRDQAALDALDAALEELEEAASRFGIARRFEAHEGVALLRDALSAHAVSEGGLRGGAVRIVALRDLAGLSVTAAVLVGLRDGELPAPAVDDPLLSIADCLAVGRALAQRPDGPRYTFDVAEDTRMGVVAFSTGREVEPLLFHLAAASPSEHLVLTRSLTDERGRPLVASPILADALEALGDAGVEVRVDAPPVEPAPALERAASFDEVRRAWVRVFAASVALPEEDPLDVSGLLARVRIERARLSTVLALDGPSAPRFCGQIGAGLRQRPARMSASALEALARCPFQYFAKRVLGLDADLVAEDDPDARRQGTIAHACFQAAVEALMDGGFVPYDEDRLDEALAEARRAAEATAVPRFAALPIDEHVAALARDDTVDRVVAVVRSLFEAGDGFAPVAVEQVFGPDGPWPALEVGGVAIRGRIDLVERRGDEVRVTDLKSGARHGLEEKLQPAKLGQTELQLPIYAAAAGAALGSKRVDARYLSLKDGAATRTVSEKRATGRNWKRDPRDDVDVSGLARDDGTKTALAGRLEDLIERIASGDFAVRPEKGACQYCDFKAVCRLPRGAPDAEDVEEGS